MRRTLALALAGLALLRAAPAAAEPLDMDVRKLGSPLPGVYQLNPVNPATAAQAAQYAADARQRFALLSSEMGLAMSSFILSDPGTTGYSGFAVGLETAYAPVPDATVGGQGYWPTRGPTPSALTFFAIHARKGLPFGLEIGARVLYLNQSSMPAIQGEVKWAILEGFRYIPDLAVHGAWTVLENAPDWHLDARDLDVMLGKRIGVGGIMSLAPYAAFRLTWIQSTTDRIDFAPALGNPSTIGSFPAFSWSSHLFLRYALGVRMVAGAFALGLEATYFPGKTFAGKAPAALGPSDFPAFTVKSAFAGAAHLGLDF